MERTPGRSTVIIVNNRVGSTFIVVNIIVHDDIIILNRNENDCSHEKDRRHRKTNPEQSSKHRHHTLHSGEDVNLLFNIRGRPIPSILKRVRMIRLDAYVRLAMTLTCCS
jgi:hypothetical protein